MNSLTSSCAAAITGLALCLGNTAGALANPIDEEHLVGFQDIAFQAEHHEVPINGALFFPAEQNTGTISTVAENPVFQGQQVYSDAQPLAGQYPVVLMSHGLGGHWRTLAWLGKALAARGAIVILVDHPNSTARHFHIKPGLDHGTRVSDLLEAMEHVADTLNFHSAIDNTRLYATGFSYGGWTALSMAGVTGDLTGYAQHCAQAGALSSHCNDLNRAGFDLSELDEARWNASYKVEKITAVAAIDPGLLYGLSHKNVQDVDADVLLIGLGEGEQRLYATDFSEAGNGFLELLQGSHSASSHIDVSPANHYSALRQCKAMGAAILADEGDDPVCTDPSGADRAEIHDQIIHAIASSFNL